MYMVKKKKKRVPIIISDLITKTASSIQWDLLNIA
jgi:hypothetical protein